MTEPDSWELPPVVDPNVPSAARLYDLYLGGSSNFEADRELMSQLQKVDPLIAERARANRYFVVRVAREQATRGIRQWLDIGAGLPTQGAVHEAVREVHADAPVVYVDNDPVAVAHGHVIIARHHVHRAAMVYGDVRTPSTFLDDPTTLGLLDFTEPVGIVMSALLHFVSDDENPAGILAEIRDHVAPGSVLVFSHGTPAAIADGIADKVTELYQRSSTPLHVRSRADIEALLADVAWEMMTPLDWVTNIYPNGEHLENVTGPETCYYGTVLRAV
jgi:SAM-dependent methyltransferase